MRKFLKFLALVLALNVVRYAVGGPLEARVGGVGMWRVMEKYPGIFNTKFTTMDWATSYFYNFMLWLTTSLIFALTAARLKGNWVVRSLWVYGLLLLFFCSVSAIYMNHYTHPKAFYLWSCADGVITFTIVAVANGLLYPRLFPEEAR